VEIERGSTTAFWGEMDDGWGETEELGTRTYCWKAPVPWAWL
jgi:hypothetical protein